MTIQAADPPSFSVALCTYNGAAYLREQLDSILNQTVHPLELVIRDDGSTDNTLAFLQAFATQYTGDIALRILPSTGNLGVAGNFMTCARACTGDWIVFSDQDDCWHEDRLAQFEQAITQQPNAAAILSDGRIVDADGQPTGQSLWLSHYFYPQEQQWAQQGRAEKILARHVFVTGSALAVRRDWLQSVPDPASEFYHDEWLGWFAGENLRLLPAETFDYRQHASQQTGIHTTWRAKWEHLQQSQLHSRQLLERDLRRFPGLALALEQAGHQEAAQLVREKLKFIAWRLALPRFFPSRLILVALKWLAGDYQRFSIAHRSLIKDIFVHFPK